MHSHSFGSISIGLYKSILVVPICPISYNNKVSATIDIGDSSTITAFSSNLKGHNLSMCIFLNNDNNLYFSLKSMKPFGISIIIFTSFPK